MTPTQKIELTHCFEPQIRQFGGPIFFTTSQETPLSGITASGSFGLVDTGRKKLLVTCYHVRETFQQERSAHPDLSMWICFNTTKPVAFAPERPVDGDRRFDIATFEIDPAPVVSGGREFFPLDRIPAPPIAVDDSVGFIGFPGYLRSVVDDKLGFGRQPYGVCVQSVDGLRFHADVSKMVTEPDHLRGISGSPCFKLRSGRPIQLVGFATAHAIGHLCFSHARCLNADGSIVRTVK
jgi:hypothetical protein